jgi:RNA polymerase sigma-70 factor (ECF subfamily)
LRPQADYPTDEQILARFRRHGEQEAAFRALVLKYQKPLYRHLRRIVLSHEETDDLLQNVFMKVWDHLGSFRGDSKLKNWLYRIATNEAISHLRRIERQRNISLDDDESAFLRERLAATTSVDGDKLSQRFQEALLRLPERQRVVFELRYYEEMPYKDMAEVLNLSEGALKASYHHAYKKLKKQLTELDF